MIALLELSVDLWIFGVPVVLLVWSVLRLMTKTPARVRYVAAIAGFVASLAVPLSVTFLDRNPLQNRSTLSLSSGSAEATALGAAIAEPLASPVTMLWGGVALLLVIRDVIGHARLRRTRRDLLDAPETLALALEWPSDVPLVLSAHMTPFTVGLLRPAVVLPADLAERFPMDIVRPIARHELSHARWRDPLVFAVLRIVAAFFWIAPVWPVLGWVRRERESAADASALRGASGEERSYVAALVRLAILQPARDLAPAMAASDLEYRARRILAPQRVSVTAVVVLAAGSILLSIAAPAHLQVAAAPLSRAEVTAIAPTPSPVVMSPPSTVVTTPPKQKQVVERLESNVTAMEEEMLPQQRDHPSLNVEPRVEQHVHVDRRVDRHAAVARHDDGDDQVVRIVIRDRKESPTSRWRAFARRLARNNKN